ncbi:hypothetical protein DCC85_02040 [Paenibacillus sp. CAA11]|uniref:hypothetical protein n=1 Tax=Paenibacillus sp. CAA11 TaxID=1532905 RepID=UPI000D3BBF50|nr:hypothetical protein [Paenibacillus sp. CAA11]AWB43130.1 hypothetical protein DCC85_02040 [Paenibacillus sp. CAA11]
MKHKHNLVMLMISILLLAAPLQALASDLPLNTEVNDEKEKEPERMIVTEDAYGFKISYDKNSMYGTTDAKMRPSRGPYDELGNEYALLTLSISYQLIGADVPTQFKEVESILRQRIKPKVVDAMMKYAKAKTTREQELKDKTFDDGVYQIFVGSQPYGDLSFMICKKTVPTKITKEDVYGFKISYDKSSRYSKNHLTIMKGPFGENSTTNLNNRLFIIGIAYEHYDKNISAQYAETAAILKQRMDANTVNAIIKQAKVVTKNSEEGGATAPKLFKTKYYQIQVANGPAGGVEVTVCKNS